MGLRRRPVGDGSRPLFPAAFGNTFLRRLVEILPTFRDKRQAIEISQQIEHDISAYLITIMNALVGLATACVMWLCGLGDPILWGAAAYLLNYIPFLGPAISVVMFILAGLLAMDSLWRALAQPALYFAIHLIEGETITPMLALHAQSGPCYPVPDLLVLDAGRARSGPGGADACNHQVHLRQNPIVGGLRSLSGRIAGASATMGRFPGLPFSRAKVIGHSVNGFGEIIQAATA